MADRQVRKLRVTKCEAAKTFTNKNGRETTLYEVDAQDENGGVVAGPLKSFQALKLNELLDYEVEPYNHERFGLSYTLYPKGGGAGGGGGNNGGSGLGKSLDELRDEFHAYKDWLNGVLVANGINLNLPEKHPELPTDVPADTTDLSQPAVASDDDIPF